MKATLQSSEQAIVYRAKIGLDIALPVVLLFTILIVLFLIDGLWLMALFLFGLLCLIACLFYTTTYTIAENTLYIKGGFLYTLKVDISAIRKIKETNNPISSPAASLDRLEIAYNKWGSVLISPADKTGFIQHLLRLNPNIIVQLKEQQK